MRRKLMSIEDKHFEWLEKNALNLSKFIRNMINEKMEEQRLDQIQKQNR